jgi:hypothetical protein
VTSGGVFGHFGLAVEVFKTASISLAVKVHILFHFVTAKSLGAEFPIHRMFDPIPENPQYSYRIWAVHSLATSSPPHSCGSPSPSHTFPGSVLTTFR